MSPRSRTPSGPRPRRRPWSSAPGSGYEERRGEEPMRLAESLSLVSTRLGVGPSRTVAVIFGRWEEIVGDAVAAHVRPLHLDGDTIVVGADHPAWVTQIRQLAPEILERLREACGEEAAPLQLQVRVLR